MLANAIHSQDTRIIPVSPPNRVKTITKLENGSLRVEQQSGNIFEVSKDEPDFQVYLVYLVLNEDA